MTLADFERPAWMALAECRGCPPDLFHPRVVQGPAGQQALAEAREICRRCDVQVECLTYALNTGQADGIWGGLTARQRTRLRRKRAGVAEQRGPIPADVTRPIDHGTLGGAAAHRRRGETPCATCLRAAADYTHYTRPSRAESA